ncbi:hypothetical protein LCGC14_2924820 [marine sediment metagenome]|uniref:Uncharacterized protein n=1 Tax=marine sediment metagenome TaxID=412755 RepID=A0A0F8XN30_9ZZZZ
MNQKDYKEIVGIIKKHNFGTVINVAIDLAEYFERTQCIDDTCDCHVFRKNIDCCIVCSPHKDNKFNKQQFLKDCEVN